MGQVTRNLRSLTCKNTFPSYAGHSRYKRKLNPKLRIADNGHGGVPVRDYLWGELQVALDLCTYFNPSTLPICFPPEVIR